MGYNNNAAIDIVKHSCWECPERSLWVIIILLDSLNKTQEHKLFIFGEVLIGILSLDDYVQEQYVNVITLHYTKPIYYTTPIYILKQYIIPKQYIYTKAIYYMKVINYTKPIYYTKAINYMKAIYYTKAINYTKAL
jgi:hypothetical protein